MRFPFEFVILIIVILAAFRDQARVDKINKENTRLVKMEQDYEHVLQRRLAESKLLKETALTSSDQEQAEELISIVENQIKKNNLEPKTEPTFCYWVGYKHRYIKCDRKYEHTERIHYIKDILYVVIMAFGLLYVFIRG